MLLSSLTSRPGQRQGDIKGAGKLRDERDVRLDLGRDAISREICALNFSRFLCARVELAATAAKACTSYQRI